MKTLITWLRCEVWWCVRGELEQQQKKMQQQTRRRQQKKSRQPTTLPYMWMESLRTDFFHIQAHTLDAIMPKMCNNSAASRVQVNAFSWLLYTNKHGSSSSSSSFAHMNQNWTNTHRTHKKLARLHNSQLEPLFYRECASANLFFSN